MFLRPQNIFPTALLCYTIVETKHVCMNYDLFYYYNCQKDLSGPCLQERNGLKLHDSEVSLDNHFKNSQNMASNSQINGFYRPRSALARALYEKQRNDMHLQEVDKNEWYQVNKSLLTPELQQKFVQLSPDEETKDFLANSIEKSTWVWTQIWYLLAKAVLRHFWSITDINGWLGRGSMFVLSQAQARTLLRPGEAAAGALVDVGAGDGEVSRRFAPLYAQRFATEISASMRKMLASKGYTLLDPEEWWLGGQFSCVCMLNLLDRCSRPRSMLRQARAALPPAGGVLLVALVLPYKPYVEVTPDHKPEERLPIDGATFEDQVTSFVHFMSTIGFELSAWSRAPYLCEGDFNQAYYWLDDSVYVFKPTPIANES